jgi:hypothetical protein
MSTGLVIAILVGCVGLIGAVYAVYKRGAKGEEQPSPTAKQ